MKPYTKAQIRLHWIMFALIAFQFIVHEPIAEAYDDWMDEGAFEAGPLVIGHVLGGLAVLALVVWRLALRRRYGAPGLPEAEGPLGRVLAHLTHGALYALMILMPVSGALAWFGSVEAAGEAHEALRIVLLGFFALHVIGALYHQFVLRTNLMERMKRPGAQ